MQDWLSNCLHLLHSMFNELGCVVDVGSLRGGCAGAFRKSDDDARTCSHGGCQPDSLWRDIRALRQLGRPVFAADVLTLALELARQLRSSAP